jgi:NTE family protein
MIAGPGCADVSSVLSFRRQSRAVGAAPGAPRSGVAFVLSGGGNLGAAQVGGLLALLDAGVRPDVVVGCSVGALNGTYLAADPTVAQAEALAEVWRALSSGGTVFGTPRRRQLANVVRGRDHILEDHGLRDLIRRLSPVTDLGSCAVPMHVVTTDLELGAACWFSSGPCEEILAASAALPGLFPPVELNGHLHVDGGVLEPLPVGRALDLGIATTFVLDVTAGTASSGVRGARRPRSALDVLVRSFEVSRVAHTPAPETLARLGQEVVVLPLADTSGLELRDFSRTSTLIDESREVAARFLDDHLRLSA